jgi:ketosteroid isomerase-like protein
MNSTKTATICAVVLVMSIAFSACKNKNHLADSQVLADTDRFYSELSAKKGMNTAFLAMFDSAGVMLSANHAPIEGFLAIKTYLLSESDTSFTLTWEPIFAKISASGEMGYTYGTYQIKDKTTDSIAGVGKYTTIWQKKSNGSWKAMLDTGNPGLGEKK